MSCTEFSLLIMSETAQAFIVLACVWVNFHTLKDAIRTRNRVIKSGQNHGAKIWSAIAVRTKSLHMFVPLLGLCMTCDRIWLLFHGYHPDVIVRFVIYGIARTVMCVLVAIASWLNMHAYHQLRDQK